jgi:hypothetical protein
MKNQFSVCGMLAMALALGLVFIGCDTGTSSGSGEPVKVATPTASPAAGLVDTGTEITLSTSTGGAAIRYTTDGTNPTSTTGTVYSASSKPVITVNATIKAIAYKEGMTGSDVLAAAYTIIPIEISSLEQLNAISANAESLSKSYKLTADITGVTTPIGYASGGTFIPFTGDFDGNGYTVTVNITSGLVISSGNFAGLFAAVGGSVHDLMVAGTINITGGDTVLAGGVAGITLPTASVSNAASSVAVTVSGSGNVMAGGVLGLSQGVVNNVYTTGNVSAMASGSALAGGILGRSQGTVSNVYATGNVSATTSDTESAYAGGIAGTVSSSGGAVSYAYATGSISAAGTGVGIVAEGDDQTTVGAGGIAGAATGAPMRYTVALNSSITASGNTYNRCSYRITSTKGGEVITNGATNYGKDGLIPSGGLYGQHEGADKEDGVDVSTSDASSQTWWTNTGFSGADWNKVWDWDSCTSLPVLR